MGCHEDEAAGASVRLVAGLDAEPRRSLGAVRPASRNERLSRTLNATGQFLQVDRDDFDENYHIRADSGGDAGPFQYASDCLRCW